MIDAAHVRRYEVPFHLESKEIVMTTDDKNYLQINQTMLPSYKLEIVRS
jgi:hypothetical protein